MQDFRDPSVSWNEAAHKWIMAVALPTEHKIRFYSSANLKDWALASDFGPTGSTAGAWECPDLLAIPSASGKDSLWTLKVGINPGAPQGGSGEQFFLGSFDGARFTALNEPGAHGWTNAGKDDYCAISYNGLPASSKPVLLGWMNNWQYAGKLPTSPWRGQFSLPRRLTYIHDQAGYALRQSPVIAPLRTGSPQTITSRNATHIEANAPYELNLSFPQGASAPTGIRLRSDADHYTEIGFDPARHLFYIDRTHSGLAISKDFSARTEAPIVSVRPLNLTLIVDRSSVEAYAQDETIAMTDLIFPPSPKAAVEFFPPSSKAITGKLWRLSSAWPMAHAAK
jgi:sucrose-6-phosphate hydrolase SacC (GH32 family)